ncbi:exonuclease domain-containing protein [Micromonospora sp. M12]
MAQAEYVQESLAGLDPAVGGWTPRCRSTRPPSWWSTWRPPVARRTAAASPRSARSRCAVASSWGAGDPGQPGQPIPPFITVLTGITQAMLVPAPPIEQVLPSFLEFIDDAVLVVTTPVRRGVPQGRLRQARLPLAQPRVLDTAALARRVLTRDEVPNRKLGTLAAYFRTATQPTHRALDDAKATVDVLHGLIGRLGGHRVDTVGDAIEFARAVTPTQRRKRHLAEGLPKVPGSTSSGRRRPAALRGHVGRHRHPGAQLLHRREKRARISEMLGAAERVEAVECAHSLEAEVRELRLIADTPRRTTGGPNTRNGWSGSS